MALGLIESVVVALIGGIVGGMLTPWYRARVERIQKRREMLEPVYNEICAIADGGLKTTTRRRWRSVSPADRLHISAGLRDRLDEYEEKRKNCQRAYGQLFYTDGLFDKHMPNNMFDPPSSDNQGPSLRVASSENEKRLANMSPDGIIKKLELYDAESPNELRDWMVRDARDNSNDASLNTIRAWDEDFPNWADKFYDALQSDLSHEWISKRNEIQSYAAELRPSLRYEIMSVPARLKDQIAPSNE